MINFTKMHGCGNDYVYVNCFKEKVKNPAQFSMMVSDRRRGIGSDGLIMICPSSLADFKMWMFNADGSEGKMCGNGIRCVGKYVYDNKMTDRTELSIETASGIKYLKLNVTDEKVDTVRVDMGQAIFEPDKVPFIPEECAIKEEFPKCNKLTLLPNGSVFEFTCLSMGNPHCVTFINDVDGLQIEKFGHLCEFDKHFPEHINTEFVQAVDKHNIKMRVWERGSNETFACGTGACASAVAAIINDIAVSPVTVHMLGGTLSIEYDRASNEVFMTGPAVTVFTGSIEE